MSKITAYALGLFALILSNGASLAQHACNFEEGEDRWGIKTSLPDGALDQTVREVSLESLIDSANPALSAAQKKAIADRRWAGRLAISDKAGEHTSLKEGDIISVEGFLYRARCQHDGDYHLEIGTSDNKSSPCLIVEAPDPSQVSDQELKNRISEVRRVLDTLDAGIFTGAASAKPVAMKVTGQFFLDAHHIGKGNPGGNRGTHHCATNVWEIHPITILEVQ